jgi:uncharacterized repeat protein (TIGR03843 family)
LGVADSSPETPPGRRTRRAGAKGGTGAGADGTSGGAAAGGGGAGAGGRRGRTGREADPPAAAAAAAAAEHDLDIDLLEHGELEIRGRLAEASNATMYCTITRDGREAACVYKPIAGERPLWDFPHGTLAGRELAAYAVSRASGWDIVPPTIYRDGPFGPGMCQLWIESDPTVDLVALARSHSHDGLRAMAVFDAVINNADRKIGHLLPAPDGHLYGCDHGVCFAEEYKLRTVLWQWRGDPLTPDAVLALERIGALLDGGELAEALAGWLTADEVAATKIRVELLLRHRVHPHPPQDWPAVPWPPI